MASAARCPRSLEEYRSAPASARSATRAFLLSSAYVSFWGSNNHLRLLIERVHAVTHSVAFSSLIGRNRSLPFERGSFSLIDVGAGQYNSVGGDISHALLYARLWSCDELGAILGFEPTEEAFRRLVRLREEEERERGARPCMQLVQKAVGRSVGAGDMAPQAGAGHNTASLDRKFAPRGVARTRVEVTTIDEQLSGPLARQDVLVLKVDVEGYEMSVLRGATNALHSGRIHLILLEYGDKANHAIWDSMREAFQAHPAAESPRDLPGVSQGQVSLVSLQAWADRLGYDTFLVGSHDQQPLLLPVWGAYWDDAYELCRDKTTKYSRDGIHWNNLSAWTPDWRAVCWYDVALLRRASPLYRPLLFPEGVDSGLDSPLPRRPTVPSTASGPILRRDQAPLELRPAFDGPPRLRAPTPKASHRAKNLSVAQRKHQRHVEDARGRAGQAAGASWLDRLRSTVRLHGRRVEQMMRGHGERPLPQTQRRPSGRPQRDGGASTRPVGPLGLPVFFCRQLERGWYPQWIDAPLPRPSELRCTKSPLRPGEVCSTFVRT